MKKMISLLLVSFAILSAGYAQTAAKAVYLEVLGPGGLYSVNYDMRFTPTQNGLGFRVGFSTFSYQSVSIVTIPIGINYLIGHERNFFEVGVGYTYASISSKTRLKSKNFSSSFGNATLGYRFAPVKGGVFFKVELSPLLGNGFFIPWGGIGVGYKF